MDKDFLLQFYGSMYDSEAGPWNLSVENKYLEYMITKFFEENFEVKEGADICNVGIGAGFWDRYLSYKLVGGSLTCIDIDETCCRQLAECLLNENNPSKVNIIHSDVLEVNHLEGTFDIVTMVGSARLESGLYESILTKAFSMVKENGTFYYQSLDENETNEELTGLCEKNGMKVENYLVDNTYGAMAQYWKIVKG